MRDLCLPQPPDPQDQGGGHRPAHQGGQLLLIIHTISLAVKALQNLSTHNDAGTETIGIPWI